MSERLGLVKVVEEDEGGEDLVLPAAEEVGLSEELDEGEADLEGVRAAGKGIVANEDSKNTEYSINHINIETLTSDWCNPLSVPGKLLDDPSAHGLEGLCREDFRAEHGQELAELESRERHRARQRGRRHGTNE